jgi:hypothetical protein
MLDDGNDTGKVEPKAKKQNVFSVVAALRGKSLGTDKMTGLRSAPSNTH